MRAQRREGAKRYRVSKSLLCDFVSLREEIWMTYFTPVALFVVRLHADNVQSREARRY